MGTKAEFELRRGARAVLEREVLLDCAEQGVARGRALELLQGVVEELAREEERVGSAECGVRSVECGVWSVE